MPYANCTRWSADEIEIQIHRGCFWSPGAAQRDLEMCSSLSFEGANLVPRDASGQATDLDELDVFCAVSFDGSAARSGRQRLIETRDLARYLPPNTVFTRIWGGPSRMGAWSGFFDRATLAIPNNFDLITRSSETNDGVFVISMPSSREDPDAIIAMDLDCENLDFELRALATAYPLPMGSDTMQAARLDVRRIAYEKLDRHWFSEPVIHALANAPSSWAAELMNLVTPNFAPR